MKEGGESRRTTRSRSNSACLLETGDAHAPASLNTRGEETLHARRIHNETIRAIMRMRV